MKNNYYSEGYLYYINGLGRTVKAKATKAGLQIYCTDNYLAEALKILIEKFLGDTPINTRTLGDVLNKIPQTEALKAISRTSTPAKKAKRVDINSVPIAIPSHTRSTPGQFGGHTNTKFFNQSLELDLRKIPFVNKYLPDDLTVIVDTSEPIKLFELFQQSIFPRENVFRARLPIGDIKVLCNDTLDELIIERKTVTDLKAGILNEHCHDQIERYYDYIQEKADKGITVKLYWIVEAEEGGNKTLYDSLPAIQHMEGWIGYSFGISDQPIHQTFSTHHTCYSICKMSQCYFERELFYKLKSHNHKANRTKSNRDILTKESKHSGVFRRDDNLAGSLAATGIPINVAVELSKLNKSFREVAQMTKKELLAVKGIGETIANNILKIFDNR